MIVLFLIGYFLTNILMVVLLAKKNNRSIWSEFIDDPVFILLVLITGVVAMLFAILEELVVSLYGYFK